MWRNPLIISWFAALLKDPQADSSMVKSSGERGLGLNTILIQSNMNTFRLYIVLHFECWRKLVQEKSIIQWQVTADFHMIDIGTQGFSNHSSGRSAI